jgi:16S rRNA (guanine527-N7)-methyltransferase
MSTGDSRDCDFKAILTEAAGRLGISLSERDLALFSIYKEELIVWNRIISLVAIKSSLDLPIKHFIDSLTALPLLLPQAGLRLLDVGAGAGFPGLPLKIVHPEIDLYLLEASRKKVSFLKELVRKLGMTNVTIIHERVEQVLKKKQFRESFDFVISRAAFKIPELLAMALYFLPTGGQLLALRGPGEEGSNQNACHLVDIKGICLEKVEEFRLPITGVPRKIFLYKKS